MIGPALNPEILSSEDRGAAGSAAKTQRSVGEPVQQGGYAPGETTSPIHVQLAQIDLVLARLAQLASELQADPDEHVRRSAADLRAAFSGREAIEPAVARVRDSVRVLQRSYVDDSGPESRYRSHGADYLEDLMERELLPELRRIGFDV